MWLYKCFKFNDAVYEQIKGTLMGSFLLRFLAEAVKKVLGSIALPWIQPKLWDRNVGDTCVIIEQANIEEVQNNEQRIQWH